MDQVRCLSRDKKLLAEVLEAARGQVDGELKVLREERAGITRDLVRQHAELRKLAASASSTASVKLADLHERIGGGERRIGEIDARVAVLERERLDEADVGAAFGEFENVWGQLSPREQGKLLALLVARVEYDAKAGTVSVSFHATGIKGLSEQPAMEEAA